MVMLIGDKPFFAAADKDHRKFEPLGGVKGHQCHLFRPWIMEVCLALQRQMGQECGDAPAKGFGKRQKVVHVFLKCLFFGQITQAVNLFEDMFNFFLNAQSF